MLPIFNPACFKYDSHFNKNSKNYLSSAAWTKCHFIYLTLFLSILSDLAIIQACYFLEKLFCIYCRSWLFRRSGMSSVVLNVSHGSRCYGTMLSIWLMFPSRYASAETQDIWEGTPYIFHYFLHPKYSRPSIHRCPWNLHHCIMY